MILARQLEQSSASTSCESAASRMYTMYLLFNFVWAIVRNDVFTDSLNHWLPYFVFVWVFCGGLQFKGFVNYKLKVAYNGPFGYSFGLWTSKFLWHKHESMNLKILLKRFRIPPLLIYLGGRSFLVSMQCRLLLDKRIAERTPAG